MKEEVVFTENCKKLLMGIIDVQDMMSGKWKYVIIAALFLSGKMRFMDLKRRIDGISPKVLSNELKDLEMNHLVTRTVRDTKPVTVEYELTELGKSFIDIIEAMGKWGMKYRQTIINK